MQNQLSSKQKLLSWAAQILAFLIMFQTLFFKFSGAEESVYIFSTIGIEPWGRYGTGILELIACIFLLLPNYSWIGAAMGGAMMSGAILIHLTVLGTSVEDDHGYLFVLAVITLFACMVVLYIRKGQIPFIQKLLPNKL
jgi:hypothetical protein